MIHELEKTFLAGANDMTTEREIHLADPKDDNSDLYWRHHTHVRVVPQVGIVKLVNITPITLVFVGEIFVFFGEISGL